MRQAIRNFARSWILDPKERRVRVNVLSPGPTDTPMLCGIVPAGQVSGMVAHISTQVPMGRIGYPDEVAKVVALLASDDNSFTNCIELFVDGGMVQI